MKITVSSTFYPLFDRAERYLVLCGGRGSGKSEFAARKIFLRCMKEGGHRFLILRKVRKTAKESVLELMKRLLDGNKIKYEYNKSDRIISFYPPNGKKNELLFDGLDDPEKIKSIKGLTGIWIEETTEFTKRDFIEVDLCLREPGPSYKQIIMSFNPDEAIAPWLKKEFFDTKNPEAYIHNSTIEDNPIAEVRHEYQKQLDRLTDTSLHKIYRLGQWAMPKGQIYSWDVWKGEHPSKMNVDEVFYGGDFGYSVNPAVDIRIYRKGDEFWVEEVIYETGLTNPQLVQKIKDRKANDAESYWDSAEPKSIDELYNSGIRAKRAEKGPDSVRAGIDFVKSKKVHIIDGSTHIINERNTYKWKEDKNGNTLPEPVKFNDHAMDAIRYGIFTHCKKGITPRITILG